MVKNRQRFRRRVIQLFSALLYNANITGFFSGKIYSGALKSVCVPGLNCYSCPGAVAACPLGSLQVSFGSLKYGKLSFYVLGTLLLFGALMGRAICGFLCPFGLIQELLYKIPTPKIKKSRITRELSVIKYAVLAIFVVALPIMYVIRDGTAVPGFCKYICPAGTLEGGLPILALNPQLREMAGGLFGWKLGVLVVILIGSVFLFRLFCRFLCPLGAIYSFFNRTAPLGVRVAPHECTGCGACVRYCKLDVKQVNDRECVRCGECARVCPTGAIDPRLFHTAKGEQVSEKK